MSQPSQAMRTLDVATIPLAGLQLIEASAGTGKTHAITALYLRALLEAGLTVRDVLVVTFTRAATEELRGRIRERLVEALHLLEDPAALAAARDLALATIVRRAATDAEAKARALRDAIAAVDEAAIHTIHGFCQRALRDHAFDSGQLFTAELTESEQALVATAVTDWWRRRFYADAGLAAFAASRLRLATPDALLRWLGEPLRRRIAAVRAAPVDRARLDAAARALPLQWRAERDAVLAAIDGCDHLSRKRDLLDAQREAAAALDEWGEAGGLAPPGDASALTQAALDGRVTDAKRKKGLAAPQIPFAAALGEHLEALRVLELDLLGEALAACRRDLDRVKRRANVMAFDDLVVRLHDALHGAGGERLAARLAQQYRVALVDEFQDTDPLQFGIFDRVYHDREGAGLLVIGDPKQAIYSFRGADIHAYLAAKRGAPAMARHTMDVNWRSTRPLVDAVNALFGRLEDPFLYAPDIGYTPVSAAGRADAEPLLLDGGRPAPLRFWVPEEGGPLNNGEYCEASLRALAAACAALLGKARRGAATLGGRPLRPRDVAVLVRTGAQADQVQRVLRHAGVGSAVSSRDSVLASDEARELGVLLDAVLDPRDERAARRALASPLWGMTAAEIDALLRDDAAWDERLGRLRAYRRTWREAGFLPMFRCWLHREGVAARLLALSSGERSLTNLLHLAELLGHAARERATPEALRAWLADAVAGRVDVGEARELRLESDENLVQVLTQHKAKGLQFPVVFLPFAALAAGGGREPLPLRRDPDGRVVLDYVEEQDALRAAERERLAEDLRLLYVSLTRATQLCVVSWGAVKPGSGYVYPALAHLLHAQPGQAPAEADAAYQRVRNEGQAAMRAHLAELAQRASGAIAIDAPPADAVPLAPAPADGAAFSALPVRRTVADDWAVTSYSELARHAAQGEAVGGLPPAEGAAAPVPGTIATLPRGRRAGLFFHGLLESLDFTVRDPAALRAAAQVQLRRSGFDERWADVVACAVDDLLDTPLADGLRLRDLDATRRRNEVGFCYPIHGLTGARLARAVPSLAVDAVATPRFTFAPCSGLMKGFVDLVFEHAGRYYLADWKTNWLGPAPDDYGAERIAEEMRRHHYDLQYFVYAIALHRHLRQRLPDYDCARHFGGVYYFFVRGMTPATGMARGVFFDRPSADTIAALDAVFGGTAP